MITAREPALPGLRSYLLRLLAMVLAVAVVIAVVLVAEILQGMGVRPGRPAAAPAAVSNESQPGTVSLPAPRPTCTNASSGWAIREDREAGVPDLTEATISRTGSVVGYLDSFTAVCGENMSVHLSSRGDERHVRLRALRVGDYQGRGARLVWQSGVLTVHRQKEAAPTGPDRVIAETWPVAATIPIEANWPAGMYLIEIAPLTQDRPSFISLPVGRHQPSFIPLVVRTSGVRSPHLVVASDLTWLAYNDYGGRSLYDGPGFTHAQHVDNRSYVASVDRPLNGSDLAQVFTMTVPLVRFMSRHDISYDVTTDSSLDATPAQLHGQRSVLFGGHSEYWTKRMYDAAQGARDAGTNFGFLGANEVYWQGRIERDQLGRETALTVFRETKLDHLAKANPATTTVRWRRAPLDRDPASLVGVGMSAVGVRGAYVVNTTPVWLFAGTNLRKGSVLDLAVGNEADAQEPPLGHSPVNLQVVLHGVAKADGSIKPSLITAGYYNAPSGAGVFAAGTTYWVCDLDSTCPAGPTPHSTSLAIQQITLNLVKAFDVARAGRLHPSTATAYVSAAQLAARLPMAGIGPSGD